MEDITVIIETTKGSTYKCDYVPEEGLMKLNKVLPVGLIFPFDFGFIPNTIGDDGDPLDVIIISELQLFSGCKLDCRIIGGIKAKQKERNDKTMRNDRLIAIPVVSTLYNKVQKLSDFPSKVIEELEHFFINYNQQAGKAFKPLEHLSAKKSIQLVVAAKNESPTKRIELFIPLFNQKGKAFTKRKYFQLHSRLTKKFGGLTLYSRMPVTGFWKEDSQKTVKDKMVIYEVMASEIDHGFWHSLKNYLLKEFDQEEIVIRVTNILLI